MHAEAACDTNAAIVLVLMVLRVPVMMGDVHTGCTAATHSNNPLESLAMAGLSTMDHVVVYFIVTAIPICSFLMNQMVYCLPTCLSHSVWCLRSGWQWVPHTSDSTLSCTSILKQDIT